MTASNAERDHPAVREAPVAVGVMRERRDEAACMGGERRTRDGVARVRGEAGVYDLLDVGRVFEETGDGECVFPVGLHPEMEGFGTALGEPAVVCAWDGAGGVLEESEAGAEGGVVCGYDDCAHDDVRVAVDIFREAVEDEVGAMKKR